MAKNFTEIGINYSVFNDINFDELANYTNQTALEFVTQAPVKANEVSGGYYGVVILVIVGLYYYWFLTDKSPSSTLRYSNIRALMMSLGVMLILGLNLVQIGFMTDFISLSVMSTFFILLLLMIIVYNPS